MPKPEIDMRDILGQPLYIGDMVAASYGKRDLRVAKIVSKGQKMVTLEPINGYKEGPKYPKDCIKLTGPELTTYILKNVGVKS